MIRSMTGFAEKTFNPKGITFKIRIKSLNHRFLDWTFRGAALGEIEDKLRVLCQKKLSRGRIEVWMELKILDQARWEFRINEELLDGLLDSMKKVQEKSGEEISITAENLMNIPNLVEFQRKDFSREDEQFFLKAFEQTLDELIKTRQREGKEITGEIRKHIQAVERELGKIERMAKKQPQMIKKKLMERLEDLSADLPLNEEKLAQEVAYLAQRYDIAEEIERLRSHLKYTRELLVNDKNEPAGKALDFVSQELYREVNTINSKSQDIAITKCCLTMKNELESIRQQVQNIE